ncbi:class I SAM-dependent DNA methyltransferase [Salisediminibacterium halotolerans]|uniref:class I SAM-dependent DNA methyltransferase n=1 Tax=Salisediminibacterium halotolerans TaxID=517425 RepID=UPI000EB16F37|nr:class I SAM-dependent methyltransferase [Salisediminibacterium halotolerans]RLJ71792.1 methyltransferase family protein [Actinophytocola xinjiangensis]RPE86942.1 methyltransferase family protein [Salisediminibacterium halotolerans]TWG33005.1 methyltransferase family protein [Salisediminibacterium halotolerans]GEL08600.1 methyltransferase [Salisediminibacterium halotolerans]
MNWQVYNELAWTDALLSAAEDYQYEVNLYVEWLKQHAKRSVDNVLHLGCGAGGHDQFLKQFFNVTGVDLSDGMLKEAEKTNPEVAYIKDDMRTVNLSRKFDAVVIPDSIMYQSEIEDVERTIQTAVDHLLPGGCLLIVTHTKEQFQNNQFSYTGSDNHTHITLFEDNFIVSESTYEAAFVYLIRQNNELSIHEEVHTLGIFPEKDWQQLFHQAGFEVSVKPLPDLYESYLQNEGDYPLSVIVGTLKANDESE